MFRFKSNKYRSFFGSSQLPISGRNSIFKSKITDFFEQQQPRNNQLAVSSPSRSSRLGIELRLHRGPDEAFSEAFCYDWPACEPLSMSEVLPTFGDLMGETMSTREDAESHSQACLQPGVGMWPTRHPSTPLQRRSRDPCPAGKGSSSSNAKRPAEAAGGWQQLVGPPGMGSMAWFGLWPGIPVPDLCPGLILQSHQEFWELPVAFQWFPSQLKAVRFSLRLLAMDTADWYREQKMGLAIQTFRRPKCEDFWKVIKSKCLIAWQIRASVIVPMPPPPSSSCPLCHPPSFSGHLELLQVIKAVPSV